MQARTAVGVLAALLAMVALWAALQPSANPPAAVPTPDPAPAPPRTATASPRPAPETPEETDLALPPAGTYAEGCGAQGPIAADGRLSLPAIEAPCEVRAVARNGGAITRGPKLRVTPGEAREVVLEVPELPPWEPPVPPWWGGGADDGLTPQQRRDERLGYLKEVLAAGDLTPEQEAATRAVVERLERDRFE